MTAVDIPELPTFLDRRNEKPLVYTYTMMHTYENICPYQCFRRYVVKDIPYVESPAMRFGNDVHSAFELRVGGGKPLPVSMQQWEPFARPFDGRQVKVELKLGISEDGRPCDFFAKNVKLRGKADCVAMEQTSAFLADWKTGNSKYEDPFELEVGALLLCSKFPQIKNIFGCYVWLKENRMGETYDLSDLGATWRKTAAIMRGIETDRASGNFEKRKGPLCAYCDVHDCENNRKPQ